MDAIDDIQIYTENFSVQDFSENKMAFDACVRQLGIVGEACNHISNEIKSLYTEIPRHEMVGLRNIVIHEYFGVDQHIFGM